MYITVFWHCPTAYATTLGPTTLLQEFKEVLPEKVRDHMTLLGKVSTTTILSNWDKYIDLTLELYKLAYPEKLSGSIFKKEKKEKKEEKKEQPKSAAATSEKKSADKGKGKE
ncbi:hypothetical protein WOLCODRAFT_150343 [Wolfiporia cocos MD-104 SS10]|uniref:Uncharacterized protein n=1 Tax=Wolfiporia cocos (strain MD-104) TaxID=742152 RepID=A0A2H3JRB9_WOLCO|nr:hypothetical protein WOLCODRAFT_150343 [Wolfiporia cocos MD-104 SS10]